MQTICYTNTPIKINATLYESQTPMTKAVILYFHGGGLLYGHRDDLPEYHINTLCSAGYAILAFDYRLCPVTKLCAILEDVDNAISFYHNHSAALFGETLPYFLWGRSAGAYLCLLSAKNTYSVPPKGIISYYGYALLGDLWYEHPAEYYKSFPTLNRATIKSLTGEAEITAAPLEKRYALYIHARQTGKWLSMVHGGSRKDLLLHYSLRTGSGLKNYPPVFLAHSQNDPDVPFDESLALSKLLSNTELFTATASEHDFDRNTKRTDTRSLLEKTCSFMDRYLN